MNKPAYILENENLKLNLTLKDIEELLKLEDEKFNLYYNIDNKLVNIGIAKFFNPIWNYHQIKGEIDLKNIDKFTIEKFYLQQEILKNYFLKLIHNKGIYALDIKTNLSGIDLGYGKILTFSPDFISFIGNSYIFNGLNKNLELKIFYKELDLAGKTIGIANSFLESLYQKENVVLDNIEDREVILDDLIAKKGYDKYRLHKLSESDKFLTLIENEIYIKATKEFLKAEEESALNT